MKSYKMYVGIDIALKLAGVTAFKSVNDPPHYLEIEQTETDYKKLARWIRNLEKPPENTLIVMEATSSYWLRIATYLHTKGFNVSVINPATAYYFSRSVLKRDKNDKVDSHLLCEMAYVIPERLKLWEAPPPIYYELSSRLKHRDALVAMRVQITNRRHALKAGGEPPEVINEQTETLLKLIKHSRKQLRVR